MDNNRFQFRIIALVISCTMIIGLMGAPVLAQDLESPAIARARQSTVYILQTYTAGGNEILSCVGSGALVSSDGLILTNAHNVYANGPCRGDRIVVALPVRLDEAPIPTYLATVVELDPALDLAVIQISGGLDGSTIDRASLNLPFVTPGDPSTVNPGTQVFAVGFPDTGDSSVSASPITISGLTGEKSGSRLAWYRTSQQLGGTMTGGGAFDATGRLIGVLTSAAPTDGLQAGSYCLPLQDSNRDGLISERDSCIPLAASVTSIRPITFAYPLIQAAASDLHIARTDGLPVSPISGAPKISRIFFSEQISDTGVPTHIVSSLPTGATSIYMFFDFDNMREGTPYQVKVTVGGIEQPLLGLGPLSWGAGRKGTWYFGLENTPIPDGQYEFSVVLAGQVVATTQFSVGSTTPESSFSNLVFRMPNGPGGVPVEGVVFPAETPEIDAEFDYANMPQGVDWTETWYLDGAQVFRNTRIWDQPSSGKLTVSAVNVQGLPLGTYRLELYIGKRLAATGDIRLAGSRGAQSQPTTFANFRVASEITRDGQPSGQIGTTMPLGVTSLYAFMDWDLIPLGVTWTYRWFLDGRLIYTSTQGWDSGGAGQNFWIALSSSKPLPEGTYAVEALIENVPMFSSTITVGSGTRPVSGEQTSSGSVPISGTVKDALTGDGIPSALIIVLNVALESANFEWNEQQIYSQAISDQNGHFVLSKALPNANYYTIYVFAEGYITIVEDTFIVPRAQTDPATIQIEMNKP